MTDRSGPAFPHPTVGLGMTMLQYYAGQVLAGVEANSSIMLPPDKTVQYAFDVAEAMVKEYEKRIAKSA